ncbi:2-phospho-L-lactate guanylyltransferase [Nocardioides immobilis]|uniref:2-phospho-L-lactate guanylyltransferase n=1 Tax=Nocardioides immobilis TaxID=2049295 RepID=UPI0015FBABE8|nr:2-phospho-L-lactate guanylyltransferase [Nocardioides immobilis]
MTSWTAIVPIKRLALAKQRLALPGPVRRALAEAFARDVLVAALETPGIDRVLAVCSDASLRRFCRRHGARLVSDWVQTSGDALNISIMRGVSWADRRYPNDHVVVIPSDLPSIDACSLASALEGAVGLDRAFVADAEEYGTSLLMASSPARLIPRYGHGSAALHRAAGHVELTQAPRCLRRDVDDLDGLQEAVGLGVGEFTFSSVSGATGAARMAAAGDRWAGIVSAAAGASASAGSRP